MTFTCWNEKKLGYSHRYVFVSLLKFGLSAQAVGGWASNSVSLGALWMGEETKFSGYIFHQNGY